MDYTQKKTKVILAQFPLETHSRGIITVAQMLRDANMEVVVIGNAFPDHMADVAMLEDADIIGISTYCGGELTLGSDLLQALENRGIKDKTICLLGGVFAAEDAQKLREKGFSGTFPPSTTGDEIIKCIESALKKLPVAIS